MAFYKGQKVVCIKDAENEKYIAGANGGRLNVVYTIRDIRECPWTGEVGLLLEEIINPLHPIWETEWLLQCDRFRPVTDITIFTDMLKEVDQKEDA